MGSDAMREALLGQTYPASWIDVVLDERFLRGGAYFIPDGSVDWDAADIGARYVPPPAAGADPGAWRRGDEVFVPCRDSDGRILAVTSLGEPVSGRRSSDDELDFLVAVGRHAALALEQAHRTEEASRHRAALEHLFAVSSKLAGKSSIDSVLRAVCGGVRRALGFRKVLIELVDPVTGTLSPAATAGWPGSEAPSWDVPVAEVERLLDPEFEIGGCYLMPGAAGRARAGHDHVAPEGERNGRPARVGPPLAVRAALRPGRARARPHLGRRARRPVVASRARLEALALFAGQATTAIVSARQLEQLRALADQDPLTGLPNRRAFVRVLENEFTRARRYGHPLALVLGDVDAFKQINDTYGHPGGDRALRAVADALRAGLRETDGAFRIGGDEFAGILPMTTGREAHAAVRRLEDRFRAGAPEPFIAEVHMSCGFATLRGGRADASLYAAKRARMAAR